ncbi:hypothetical protein M2322_000411 [Rhodoblastus acidophilus]|uniref:hypothetical protein n=1 Tax=Rhodoblastus acidophilus TaxID=1074 RepID=UPI002225AE76|nr:hypothetical protein [Rhodoblastus acidophilus]MCW2314891.1 hypothetical protein [Rhodoblastus acidophilus]
MAPLPLNYPIDFITLPPFSDDEWKLLEKIIRGRFSEKSRTKIVLYASIYASGLSFWATRPFKRDVDNRLRLIAKTAEKLEALIAAPEVRQTPAFEDAVRRLCFWLGQFDDPKILLDRSLEGPKKIAEAATNAVRGERGRPRDLTTRRLVQLLLEECHANGIKPTMPANENKGEEGNKTPFFEFAKQIRLLVAEKAQISIIDADLTDDAIGIAKDALFEWADGKDSTLIEIMREVRKEMRNLPARQNT